VTHFPDRHGLQPERTALAWQRTGITATASLLPLLLVNARLGSTGLTVLGAAAAIAGAYLVLHVPPRLRQLHDDRRRDSPFDVMVRIAAVTTLAALGGLVTAVNLALR
jgi:hypothetical protein